jgi:hypothetical protein
VTSRQFLFNKYIHNDRKQQLTGKQGRDAEKHKTKEEKKKK